MLRANQNADRKDGTPAIPTGTQENFLLSATELDELEQQLPPHEFKRFMQAEFLGHKLPYADEQKICCDTPELQIKRLGKKASNTLLPDGLVVFSLWNKTTKKLGISFRGTQDKPSIGRDLESNPGHDTFHKGASIVSTEINLILGEIERAHPSDKPDITIDIYGHSLGGADAQRCVGLLLKNIVEWSDKNVEQAITYFNKIKCIHLHCLNTPGIAQEDADNALLNLTLIKSKSNTLEIMCDWIDGANDLIQAAGDTNLFTHLSDENMVKHRMLHIEHTETETNWLSSVVFFVYHFTQRAIKAHTGTAFTTQSNIAKWFYATNATLKGATFINAKATNKSLIDTSHAGKMVKNFLHACYNFVVPDTAKESSDPSHLPLQPFILVEHEDSIAEVKKDTLTPSQPTPQVNIHSLLLEHKTKDAMQLLLDVKHIDDLDDHGMSLLQLAAREGLNDVVTYLCFKGAKLTAAESKRNNSLALQAAIKTPMDYAIERGHDLIVRILQAFTAPYADVATDVLKALYVWALKNFASPEGLTLPTKPSQEICQGLLELAAFLNKRLWAEDILSYHENFQLRQHTSVRTPAYWAASHNNDELFKKLSHKENNLLLTLWQLKQEKPILFIKYLTPETQVKFKDILKYLPHDGGKFTTDYKYTYLAILENDSDFIKGISDEKQRELKIHALFSNSFVALTIMQNELHKADFLASSLSSSALVEYELISQNDSYYDFLLLLNPKDHKEFLNNDKNKIGLLNFILSLHIIRSHLTEGEMDTYLVLIKNDKLVAELSERHIQDRAVHRHKPFLLKDLGVPLPDRKEKNLTIEQLSNDLISHIFKFLIPAVMPDVILQANNLPSSDDLRREKQKIRLSLLNRRLFALVTETIPDKINLPTLDLEIKRTHEKTEQLSNEIKTLTEFTDQLWTETFTKLERKDRCLRRATIASCVALPAILMASPWCLIKLKSVQSTLANAMSSTSVWITFPSDCYYSGYKFSLKCIAFSPDLIKCLNYETKCQNSYYDWISLDYTPPNACADLCNQSYWNDTYYKISISSAVVIPLILSGFLILRLIQSKINHDSNYLGKFHRYVELLRNNLLSNYSKLFKRNIPTVSLLLPQPIDNNTQANDANKHAQRALHERRTHYLEYSTGNRYAIARRNIFTSLFKPSEELKEVKAEMKQDSLIDIYDEPRSIPRQGSINDDLNTSLLAREEQEDDAPATPRRSLCPACVIL